MIEVQEMNLFQVLQVGCPECGGQTAAYVVSCEHCGFLLNPEEASLNLCESNRGRTLSKTPMEEAEHLLKLRQARADLASGGSLEDFYQQVDEVLAVVESALDLYESDFMKFQLQNMQPEAAQIYHRIATAAAEMEVGLQQMRGFVPGQNLTLVDAGLKRVENALWKIDSAQDLAIERAAQC